MTTPSKPIFHALLATLCLSSLWQSGGCSAPSINRGGFNSASPAARTHAIEETVRKARSSGTLQRQDLKKIVSLLIADDSMVRFMAISGLVELTDEDFGYRFFDPPEVRFESVVRWRTYALKTNGTKAIKVVPPPPSDIPEGAARG